MDPTEETRLESEENNAAEDVTTSSPTSETPPPPPVEGQDGSASTSPTPSLQSKPDSKGKIDVLLRPAGNAPILKKKKWAVERVKTVGSINVFLRKYMKVNSADAIFLYVNQAFAPSPDTEVGAVFDCFGSDGKLVLHYSLSQAWG